MIWLVVCSDIYVVVISFEVDVYVECWAYINWIIPVPLKLISHIELSVVIFLFFFFFYPLSCSFLIHENLKSVPQGNVISTPAIKGTILPGITRKSILDVAISQGFQVLLLVLKFVIMTNRVIVCIKWIDQIKSVLTVIYAFMIFRLRNVMWQWTICLKLMKFSARELQLLFHL